MGLNFSSDSNRINPNMAMELGRIVHKLEVAGHHEGAEALTEFIADAQQKGILPSDLTENKQINREDLTPLKPLPLFKFSDPIVGTPSYVHEIDALDDLPQRYRNSLTQAGITEISRLAQTSDGEILSLRNTGYVAVIRIREALEQFRVQLERMRKESDIPEDQAIILPYPQDSSNRRRGLLKRLQQK